MSSNKDSRDYLICVQGEGIVALNKRVLELYDKLMETKTLVDSYDPKLTTRCARPSLYIALQELYDSWI